MKKSQTIIIHGIVQGVGFRPFIFNLATKLHLAGTVLNSTNGVIINVEGLPEKIKAFIKKIKSSPPPLAHIQNIEIKETSLKNFKEFIIKESKSESKTSVIPAPDISTCSECFQELINKKDRRYEHPFINCVNCGPRFTIIATLPYDRANTTMRKFKMCPECQKEYESPANRRFHAEPNNCPKCGPKLELSIKKTADLLKKGKIIAVKGLGGFHLICDATNNKVVKKLRDRKNRQYKPFAIMSIDTKTVKTYCRVNKEEEKLLESPEHPIVLLRKRNRGVQPRAISKLIAPNNNYLGVLLPYTPLHHLILKESKLKAIVATSGNIADEPLIKDNDAAKGKLKELADHFLLHNRDIYMRCDDSITMVVDKKPILVRRARGYAPAPLLFPSSHSILACGPELKNSFCLTRGDQAFVSQYIGDLKNYETSKYYQEALRHFKHILKVKPEIVAYDLHPNYLSTKFAHTYPLPAAKKIPVQHHKAHIAAVYGENNLKEKIIGVALDGTGYGEDGNFWGFEFFAGTPKDLQRQGHLKYIPMPGGDAAAAIPYRMALSYLEKSNIPGPGQVKNQTSKMLRRIDKEKIKVILEMLEKNINCSLTSSAGRLFDAVSSLIGVRDYSFYEGQAAIELEMAAKRKTKGSYPFEVIHQEGKFIIDAQKMIAAIITDLKKKKAKGYISAKFHQAIAAMILAGCREIKKKTKIDKVCLSGGCFQNRILLNIVPKLLAQNGFTCYQHKHLPPNDGCISYGQAIIAASKSD